MASRSEPCSGILSPPVTLFCVNVSLHNFADPLAVKSIYCDVPAVYFAYCTLILSRLAVFFLSKNPKFEPVNAALVKGNDSGVEQRPCLSSIAL